MFGKLAAAAIAVGVSFALAPTASADEDPLQFWFEPGENMTVQDGTFVSNAYRSESEFVVRSKNEGQHTEDGLWIFLSLPQDVAGYHGDRWDCWDVDGGVECTNPDITVAGEEWPELTVTMQGYGEVRDSLDVYGYNTKLGSHHYGAPFYKASPGS